jgi:competence protein ComEC
MPEPHRLRLLRQFFLLDLFTPAAALALLGGALAVQTLTALPSRWLDIAIGVLGLCVALLRSRWRWLGFILIGAAWSMLRADFALSQRLPSALEGQDIVVTGTIVGLPRVLDDSTHFDFAVTKAENNGAPIALGGTLRLSWFTDAPELQPCSDWNLRVHLKRPRG